MRSQLGSIQVLTRFSESTEFCETNLTNLGNSRTDGKIVRGWAATELGITCSTVRGWARVTLSITHSTHPPNANCDKKAENKLNETRDEFAKEPKINTSRDETEPPS